MERKLIEAIATLVGLTIGAGILGIPYVVAQSGFLTGVFIILFLGLIIVLMNLYVGEITLRTKGTHQLPGYVEKFFMMISLMITVYGALTGYIIGEGVAWAAILNISPLYPMLIFFALMAIIVFRGLKLIKNIELCLNTFVIAIILVIVFLSFQGIQAENYTGFDAAKLLIPYGVVLFAFAVVGVTGINSTELATVGLGQEIGLHMLLLGNIFAAFAMGTSFLLLALALLWMYHYGYKMKKILAWALTLTIPLIIAFSNYSSFVQVLAITGTFAGGLEGILIVLTHRAAQKKSERQPEYSIKSNIFLNILLIGIYLIGMLYMLYILL